MADNGLAQAIFDCIENSTHQELFKPGDTLPDSMPGAVDIVLDDGSIVTVAAGDTIPVNSVSDVIVDELTGEASCISKSVVDQDLFLPGDNLPSDMAAPVTIVLDDGTLVTLNAGDPIPANSSSSVVVDEVTNQPACISKSVVDQDLFQPGDTLPDDMVGTVDVVLDDGTTVTLNPGDDVPANSTGAVYIDEVTNSPRCIGAKQTKDSILGAVPVGDCADSLDALVYTADSCRRVAICDLIPSHIKGECVAAGETITGPVVKTATDKVLTQTFLDKGQIGSQYVGGTGIVAATDFPITVTVPPHTQGCLLSLHVTYGAAVIGQAAAIGDGFIAGQSGALPAGKQVCHVTDISRPDPNTSTQPGVSGDVYFFEGSDGSAGSTIDLDFATVTDPNGSSGAVIWEWSEICDQNGEECNCSDFDLAGIATISTNSEGLPSIASDSIDFDGCGAVFFGSARHARYADPQNTGTVANPHPELICAPGAWFEYNGAGGYAETYQNVSVQNASCQLGTVSGVIDAGAGAFDYTHFANRSNGTGSASKICFIPTNCNTPMPESVVINGVGECDQTLVNTNCFKDSITKCCVSASVSLDVKPGDNLLVVPVINGAECVEAAFGYDNTNGTEEYLKTEQIHFCKTDYTIVPKNGGSTTTTASFRVYVSAAGNDETTGSSAKTADWVLECELEHV